MKPQPAILRLLTVALTTCCLAGCLNLKPARSTARYFILSPIPDTSVASAGGSRLAIGLGPVKLAGYLNRTSLAVRKSPTEVLYLVNALWAERLDAGCQRVLAANLTLLVPAGPVLLSSWRPEDVACEVQVNIDQLDVDSRGLGQLVAQWRIMEPGGVVTLKTGQSRKSSQGPPPGTDPDGAVATLSHLLADLSRELSEAAKTTQVKSK